MFKIKNKYFFDKKLFISVTFLLYLVFLYWSFVYFFPKKNFKAPEKVEPKTYYRVHIIGKAAIGQYLWLHLFNGSLDIIEKGFFQNGNKTIDNIIFNYYSGPGYIQNSIPHEIQFLILIINGRTSKHVLKAKEWLDFLPEIHSLKKTAIILLGNEKCQNHWILPYMKSKGGMIDVLFLVYDSILIDNKEIFQWPLGVATYRGFPNLDYNQIKHVTSPRKYKCNFMGTVYKNSSREIVDALLKTSRLRNICYLSTRHKWLPNESEESRAEYLSILQDSDFTLNPVGENTECYRIYEAVELGSIPIVEDNMTPGLCVSSLRLLKKFNPPFVFVKNWKNLHEVLQTDNLNLENIIEQRVKLLLWYNIFKKNIVTYFLNILKESFF
ncbi:unnamed protein product [Nezara viridula]|uniref:Uncharacterized protein n=1 Tax=Nezara viridula TaxID=85310 RepID=A0A9P0EAG6_NEZVI|nr:unnamed protein product [Nezara viridula]